MKSYSRFILVLSVLICAGLVAVWLIKPKDDGPAKPPKEISGQRPLPPAPPNAIVEHGAPPPPPEEQDKPIGAQKLKQLYKDGWTYKRTHDWAMGAKGQHLDWGLKREFLLTMSGSLVTKQTITENKDGRIRSQLVIENFTSFEMKLECTSLEIVIDPLLEALLEASISVAAPKFALVPGKVRGMEETVNRVLQSDGVKELIRKLPSRSVQQADAFIESLDGLHLEILYVDGEGIKEYRILGQDRRKSIPVEITKDIEPFLRSYDTNPDAYLFPDAEIEPGQSWTIKSQKLPFVLPTQFGEVKVRGTTRLQRKDDQDRRMIVESDPDGPKLTIYCEDKKNQGKWDNLLPDVHMEFEDQLVREATLKVMGKVEAKSKGHWFFEMDHSSVPELHCNYTCEGTPPPR